MNALEIIRDHGPLLVLVALFAVTVLSIMRGKRRKTGRKSSSPSEIIPVTRSDTPVSTPPADRGLERDASTPSGEARAPESDTGPSSASLAAAAGGALVMGVAASHMHGGGSAPDDSADGNDGPDGGDSGGGDGGGGDGGSGDGGGD